MAAQIGAPVVAARAHEELFAYWASRRHGAKLPARRDLHPGDIKRLLPTLSLIDVVGDPPDFRIRLAGAVDLTSDGVAVLAHDDRGRTGPALDRKCHDDCITKPWPSSEVARFILEIERSARDHFEAETAHRFVLDVTCRQPVGCGSDARGRGRS